MTRQMPCRSRPDFLRQRLEASSSAHRTCVDTPRAMEPELEAHTDLERRDDWDSHAISPEPFEYNVFDPPPTLRPRESFVQWANEYLVPPTLRPRESFVVWSGEGDEAVDDIDFTTVFQTVNDSYWGDDDAISEATLPLYAAYRAPEDAATKVSKRKQQRDDESIGPLIGATSMFTDVDVLLGRGGLVNIHAGNLAYLKAKERLQPRYLVSAKEEKTQISQDLVDAVHAWGGRFMKQCDDDSRQWYEVDNVTARKKASQTLRELPVHAVSRRPKKRAKCGSHATPSALA